MIEWRHTDQLGNRAPAQPAELGQISQQGCTQHWAHPKNSTQQVFTFAPQGRIAQAAIEFTVTLLEPPLKPADMGGNLQMQNLGCTRQSIAQP
jgi:hypothetical protein